MIDYFHITTSGISAWVDGILQGVHFVYCWDILRAERTGGKS